MDWNAVDVLVAVVLLLCLVHGAGRGIGRTLGGFAGLLLGGALALWLLAGLDVQSPDRMIRLAVLGGVLVVCMLLGQVLGEVISGRIVGGPPRGSAAAGAVDRLGGAVVGVVAGALIVLAVVGSLGSGAVPWLSLQAADSRLMQAIQRAAPQPVLGALGSARQHVVGSAAMRELDTLLFEAAPPPAGDVEDPEVLAAASSAVQILGLAPECRAQQSGSGFAVSGDRVVTNAHVVAGTQRVTVRDSDGRRHSAEVVAFEPGMDLAVLSVPDLDRPALEPGATPPAGAMIAFAGYPQGRPLEIGPAELQGTARTSMSSIDPGAAGPPVEVLQFAGAVEQGNSGGPLLDDAGRVIGVVFARSTADETGFAVTGQSLAGVLEDSAGAVSPVDTGRCQPLEAGTAPPG